jgi:hypothetical protein
LLAAFGAIEEELAGRPLETGSGAINQAGVSAAVAWHFAQQMLPEVVPSARYPMLADLSTSAEALPEFQAAPYGDGICQSR